MIEEGLIQKLAIENDNKIVMIVLDGLGDLPNEAGETPLSLANTPNLDSFAKESDLGLHLPIARGITPGSGPAHLGLFGFDPVKNNIGRGLLSALGLGFELKPGDLCVRLNFCKLDGDKVIDRRAGRLETAENERLLQILREKMTIHGHEIFLLTEKEHRAVLVIRGGKFTEDINDTDPQKEGLNIIRVFGKDEISRDTARVLNEISDKIKNILKDEEKANGVLMRGYALNREMPSFYHRFKLKALGICVYPMYKGLAKLVGMDVIHGVKDFEGTIKALKTYFDQYNFFFLHFKDPDKYGEDGNFEAKKTAIEKIDEILGELKDLNIDTLIITGDHSTPAKMVGHGFQAVPILFKAKYTRKFNELSGFSERACSRGELGIFEAREIMTMALAYASKLQKFGA